MGATGFRPTVGSASGSAASMSRIANGPGSAPYWAMASRSSFQMAGGIWAGMMPRSTQMSKRMGADRAAFVLGEDVGERFFLG